MHELSVTQSLLDMSVKEAEKAGAAGIDEIKIVIGDLTGISEECVQFSFDIISKDTIAEDAALSFKRIPAAFRCKKCGHVFDRKKLMFNCPVCGSPGVLIGRGKELYIEGIEVRYDGDKTG